MSKNKTKHTDDNYNFHCERLKAAALTCIDKLYHYNEINEANAHLVVSEMQENYYQFTKWLCSFPGTIVSVVLENGVYVVSWKGTTKDAKYFENNSSWDGVLVKHLRVK